MKKILKIIIYILLVIVLIYTLLILVQKIVWKDKIPEIFGIKNFIVSSGSMSPTINVGDLIFIKDNEEIENQDIISFRIKDSIITHRIIEIKEENGKKQFKTKGDANDSEDEELINESNIEGKYIFKIPKVGNIILFLQSIKGIGLIIILFVLYLFIENNKKLNKEEKEK